MTPTPEVQPLPYKKRKYLFTTLFVVFAVLLPSIMFYAAGYRFDFNHETNNIVGTGGLYVSAPRTDMQLFLDEEPVRTSRVFRSATYIQNLPEGTHRLNVQKEGLQIWTKDLPVYPHIVTEAAAFNMPVIPQIRIVTPYETATGTAVLQVASTTMPILPFASTTNEITATTRKATTTFVQNPEFDFVESLFGTSSTSTTSFVDRVVSGVEEAFSFATSISTTSPSSSLPMKQNREVLLYADGDEVYVRWVGDVSFIPYYYCVDHVSASSTIARYGEHVYSAIEPILASSTSDNLLFQNNRLRVCRDEIRIDRKWQNVYDFDFLPDSTDHVLMLLEQGLYVVEVDDRSWQNTQLLYPGEALRMVVDGGRIFVYDGTYYVEVLTEIPEP